MVNNRVAKEQIESKRTLIPFTTPVVDLKRPRLQSKHALQIWFPCSVLKDVSLV